MTAKTLFIAFLLWVAASGAGATDLRGRIDGINGYSTQTFPVGGVYVTIYRVMSTQFGYQYQPIATTLSGADGMYYFRGITPGWYVLQVAQVNYSPFQVFFQAGQDIQPILLHF